MRAALTAAAIALTCLGTHRADAAVTRSSSGATKFRLHGRLDLLSFHHYNPNGARIAINNLGLGIGRTTIGDSGLDPYGLVRGVRPLWSVGFGVVLLQGRLNVGTKLAVVADLGWIRDENESSTDRATIVSGAAVPYLRWIFLPGRRYRPFVELHAGLGGGRLRYEASATRAPGPEGLVAPRARGTEDLIWPQVGIMGGVHIFLIDAFSMDLGLGVDYWAPYSKGHFEPTDVPTDDDFFKDGDLVNVAVSVGGSVWF